LNGTILDLTAGANYVFNISGQLSLNSSEILDLTAADVLFNTTGTQGAQLAGGLNNESVLDGIVLAPDAQISETPGSILGEIISGQNINIASGAKIQGVASVPDSGSCMWPGRMRDRGGEKVAFMSRNCGPNDGSSIFQPFL
jgi:hypothetical protein